MAVADFNLMDPETLECPYPFYEALREEAPVHIIPEMGLAVVSTYDLLQEVVHDPADVLLGDADGARRPAGRHRGGGGRGAGRAAADRQPRECAHAAVRGPRLTTRATARW